MRWPCRVEQVRAVPVRRETAHCGEPSHHTKKNDATRHGATLAHMRPDGHRSDRLDLARTTTVIVELIDAHQRISSAQPVAALAVPRRGYMVGPCKQVWTPLS